MRKRIDAAYSVEQLRRQARASLPRAIFDFYDGGAEDEVSLAGNRRAFEALALTPRCLTNTGELDLRATVLGQEQALPLAIAPTGAAGFGWPWGDIAIARAAHAAAIPFTLPTSATASIERVARAVPGARLWFQIYMLRQRDYSLHLIERAANAGYEALVLTVDMPVGGKRERDLANGFGLPFRWSRRLAWDFARRPAWALRHAPHGQPVLENMLGFAPDALSTSEIATSVGKQYDPAFDWSGAADIRKRWPGRLLIKGVLHPGDALRAADLGFDGVIVSNHGGRQLDGCIAPLLALPAVAQAVAQRMSVLLDGGIRRGSDIIKARALGADAVMLGRPMLYGMAAGGEYGARRALKIICDEFERSMRLCGYRRNADISPAILGAGTDPADPAL